MSVLPAVLDEETLLRRHAERIVSQRLGLHSKIARIRRTPTRYIGSYDCVTVAVRLASGEEFSFFLKNYGSSQKSKNEPMRRREREIATYRELLSSANLGTAEYYGSVWDESVERYWLLLELVDGVLITDHKVEHGVLAAEWLGRAQAFFSQHPDLLAGRDYLIRHDADFFRSKTRLALRDVGRIDPVSATRLAKIADRYERAIEIMTAQPLTLVHGGYIPWHIFLNYEHRPLRVCPIDWELAAIGSAFYDLAYFTDGAEPQVQKRIWDAYRRAAVRFNVPVSDKTDMGHIVECFLLHRIFDWLSRAVEKQYSARKVAALVALAEERSAKIQAH